MVLSNWGKHWLFFQISDYKLPWILKFIMSQLCSDQSFKLSFTRETSLGFSMIFILRKKKLLAAALFMSDGYTVYILKHLECEQLPLLLSHQVSYTLYKLLFYYQRNVSLSLLIPAGLGFARLAPKGLPTCHQPRLSTVHHPRLW